MVKFKYLKIGYQLFNGQTPSEVLFLRTRFGLLYSILQTQSKNKTDIDSVIFYLNNSHLFNGL